MIFKRINENLSSILQINVLQSESINVINSAIINLQKEDNNITNRINNLDIQHLTTNDNNAIKIDNDLILLTINPNDKLLSQDSNGLKTNISLVEASTLSDPTNNIAEYYLTDKNNNQLGKRINIPKVNIHNILDLPDDLLCCKFTDLYKNKLDNIQNNAQENTIETVKINGTPLSSTNKTINIDLSKYYTDGSTMEARVLKSQGIEIGASGTLNINNGGYIDFHYNGSTDDYTSRIIEENPGIITVRSNLNTTNIKATSGNISYINSTSGSISNIICNSITTNWQNAFKSICNDYTVFLRHDENKFYILCSDQYSDTYNNWRPFTMDLVNKKLYINADTINASNISGVVDKANKLNTARKILLSGAVIGSVYFDGSKDVVLTNALDNITINASNISGLSISWNDILNKPDILNDLDSTLSCKFTNLYEQKLIGILNNAQENIIETIKINNLTLGITNKTINIDLPNFITANDNISGVADKANKLTTARKILLSGAVVGSVYFDGSLNIVLQNALNNITVDASNISGLSISWNDILNKPNLNQFKTQSIELGISGTSSSNHGGFIDFHYNGSTDDYTARIVETSSGVITINNNLNTTNITATNINSTTINSTSGNISNIICNSITTNWQNAFKSICNDYTVFLRHDENKFYILCSDQYSDTYNNWRPFTMDLVNKKLYINADTINANNISGTADKANKLNTARKILLSGAISGSVMFDGSKDVVLQNTLGNITINAIEKIKVDNLELTINPIDKSVNIDLTNKADLSSIPVNSDFALSSLYLRSYNSLTDKPDLTKYYTAGSTIKSYHLYSQSIELGTSGTASTNHGGFIDFHYNGSTLDNTSRIIEESLGTITISPNLKTTNITATSGNISNITCNSITTNSANAFKSVYNDYTIFLRHDEDSFYILCSDQYSDTFNDWRPFRMDLINKKLYIDGTNFITANDNISGIADKANKLTTPRKILLSGAVVGSVYFDGSLDIVLQNALDNITIDASNILGLNISWNDILDKPNLNRFYSLGDNIRGRIIEGRSIELGQYIDSSANHGGFIDFHYNGSTDDHTARVIEEELGIISINPKLRTNTGIISSIICNNITTNSANAFKSTYNDYTVFLRNDGTGFYILASDQYSDTFNDWRPFTMDLINKKVYIDGTDFITANDNISGIADKANKLTTPRKILLSGAITGSATFDGSENIILQNTLDKYINLNQLKTQTIELGINGTVGTNHGGYIDFHYNGSTDDYTSRIVESSSGVITITSNLNTNNINATNITTTSGSISNITCNSITANSADAFKLTRNGYTVVFKHDGTDFYILCTDQYSDTINDWRPFRMNLEDKQLYINADEIHGVKWTDIDNKPEALNQLYNIILPVGSFTWWFGTVSNIPSGWLIMDGSTFDTITYPLLYNILESNTLPDLINTMTGYLYYDRYNIIYVISSDPDNLPNKLAENTIYVYYIYNSSTNSYSRRNSIIDSASSYAKSTNSLNAHNQSFQIIKNFQFGRFIRANTTSKILQDNTIEYALIDIWPGGYTPGGDGSTGDAVDYYNEVYIGQNLTRPYNISAIPLIKAK